MHIKQLDPVLNAPEMSIITNIEKLDTYILCTNHSRKGNTEQAVVASKPEGVSHLQIKHVHATIQTEELSPSF